MKHATLAILVIILGFSCITKQDEEKSVTEVVEVMKDTPKKIIHTKNGVIIHLSSGPDEPQKVLMALKIASDMSENKQVLVYLDIDGVYTIFKDASDITFNNFPSSLTLLNELKEKGVTVIACPSCIAAADKTSEDVIDWVQIATKDKFFNFCDGKVISLSY